MSSSHRGCAEWYVRRGCSVTSQKTTRTMYSACEAVCDGLVDGYGAGGAVVGWSIRRVWIPIRVRTISGVPLSITISLHLDDFFVGAMSLFVHFQVEGVRFNLGFDRVLVFECVRGHGRKKAVVQIRSSWILKRLGLVSKLLEFVFIPLSKG